MQGEELLKIFYKGKDYTLKELVEDNNQFSRSILIPDQLHKQYSSFLVSSSMDFGYIIALDKFNHLYSLLTTARFALTQAHQKLHKSPVTWSSGYLGQLWIRSQFLKNSFLWYNSCDDYFLQIIWFAFDFTDPNKLTTQAKYKRVLKDSRWESLLKALEPKKHETEVINLLNKINEFHNDNTVKQVKSIANSLKHHADIYIKDLETQPDYLITSYQGFTSAATANKGLDIDESAILLQDMHKKVVEFASFLHVYIDFDKAFEPEEAGVINLAQRKDKATYKKFYINEY
ncbi:hypothetical protein SNE25_11940 [Mucilaginibacter sabulilitoris]|uniref:HEPN AbiU2-like domain-containing protein n=1 Tax=Mucilaginibacter sabulilitoris TaxID=1173583 RepID=A0ABZ0TWN8_9SPHI|nr:hypothetical protein [Mucilaginibacter sabulilitoris]WPU96229.1 hypothetical protein SNE25_11940 [Mucilaginibacter sabulilitoris]